MSAFDGAGAGVLVLGAGIFLQILVQNGSCEMCMSTAQARAKWFPGPQAWSSAFYLQILAQIGSCEVSYYMHFEREGWHDDYVALRDPSIFPAHSRATWFLGNVYLHVDCTNVGRSYGPRRFPVRSRGK